jgi:photosystem II stability/assembly factor-like uncharacterized protein
MKNIIIPFILILFFNTSKAQNWVLQHSVPGVEFNEINFYDSNTGWAFGDSALSGTFIKGLVLKTTDHGLTWTEQFFPTPDYRIFSSCILNQNEIFVAGRNGGAGGNSGLFSKSTDGGNSWSAPSLFPERLFSVGFIDSNTGWVGGKNGYLSKTTDGGLSWNPVSLTGEDILEIEFADNMNGLIACGGGELYKTSNGGMSWSPVASNAQEDLTSITFMGTDLVWISGTAGVVIHSTDKGSTWTVQNTGTFADLESISFYDNAHGFAAGIQGTMYNTNDGGNTWSAFPSSSTFDISAMSVKAVGSGWYCNIEGEIYTLSNPTNIMNVSGETTIKFFPNPVIDFINIISTEKGVKYFIYDLNGKMLLEGKTNCENIFSIQASKLTPGVYLMKTDSAEEDNTSFKFIKK